jgi:hypothetical protein
VAFTNLNEIMDRWKRLTDGKQYPVLTKQPRRISMGEHILNRMTHHLTVMVCESCQDAQTLKNRDYVELRRFHAEGKCDGCQAYTSVALWIFEDSCWHHDLNQEPALEAIQRRDEAKRLQERWSGRSA